MAFKVTLFSIADEFSKPEYQSPLSATKDDTYATFRGFLEGEGLVDFPLDFWIAGDKKRMLPRFERFNAVGEKVVVIPKADVGLELCKKRKAAEVRAVVLDSECNTPEFLEDLPNTNDGGEATQLVSSSRVDGEEDPPATTHLLSELVPEEIM
jgi:hypothetical protein